METQGLTQGLTVSESVGMTGPATLVELAVKHGASIEVIERLVALQERTDATAAQKMFAADYVQMKASLPRVIRLKENFQTKSNYAPLEDVNTAIDPILKQYGFGTATKVVRQDAEGIAVRAELWHSGGHVEGTEVTMPLDRAGIEGKVNKTGPWATSSSITYAKRVAVCALLNVSTGDDMDGNRETESSFPLAEKLEWIANCRNLAELDNVFKEAYKEAHAAKDKNAMKSLIDAKDKKKLELAGGNRAAR